MIPERVQARLLNNRGAWQGRPYWRRDANGCWIWQNYIHPKGYAQIGWMGPDGKEEDYAHRAMFEVYRYPIPDDLTIDHLCHNEDPTCPGGHQCLHRRCVNPFHLEPVPIGENLRRSPLWGGHRTHCPQGHPYDEANTYYGANGKRACRACNRDYQRNKYTGTKATHCVNGHPFKDPPKPAQRRSCPECLPTHCPQGHPFDEANTNYRANGARTCRACNKDRLRRYRATAKIANQTNQEN